MPRTHIPLEQIRVAEPCPMAWSDLEGDSDRVRHCAHCNLDVHNLSAMPRKDAESLVASANARLCVMYHHRGDGAPIAAPDAPPAWRRPVAALVWLTSSVLATLGLGALASCTQPSHTVGYVPRPTEPGTPDEETDWHEVTIGAAPACLEFNPTPPNMEHMLGKVMPQRTDVPPDDPS